MRPNQGIPQKQQTKSADFVNLENWAFERFVSIFFLTCEHFLFEYIVKQKQNSIRGFSKFNRNRILLEANVWNFDHSQTFLEPDRFSCFDVYWIQTDRQTDGQTEKIPFLYN